ncbi:MAG TPA: HD domain-containing protein [Thermodesulfobacteriota bacterium]|nr:HD domain-containing protein [Thermodesulfobacteriota bacterium]
MVRDRRPRGHERAAAIQDIGLIADPIYHYMVMTDRIEGERTERDVIDTPWVQRLRRIFQLQSARWVFPTAEHTRFQHSLGTMHVAGAFSEQLYPSLYKIFKADLPSFAYLDELLRLAGLLHDTGHGPFCHFFDEQYLSRFRTNHEEIGQRIIREKMSPVLKGIRRGPHGRFEKAEVLDPEQIAFLIKKPQRGEGRKHPRWLNFLQQLFRGIFTFDNIDYVLRDAYMTGVSIGPVDWRRLLYYTSFRKEGLTLDKRGMDALAMFLNARLYLYSNVYYHRTTRSIDLQLQEIFKETMEILCPFHPAEELDRYLFLTDWSVMEKASEWKVSLSPRERRLGGKWAEVLSRKLKWSSVFEERLTLREMEMGRPIFLKPEEVKQRIKTFLPNRLKEIEFHVDMAHHDPRPLNPWHASEEGTLLIFDPASKRISREPLRTLFQYIPAKVAICRVYAPTHRFDLELGRAARRALASAGCAESFETNV